MIHYKLSYPLATVVWDGKRIANIPIEKIRAQLEIIRSCGITEVMLAGYHDEEPATFDMMEECRKIGDLLRSYDMKAAQHHSFASTFAPIGSSQKDVISRLNRYIDYTAELNADVMVYHTGKPVGANTTPEIVKNFECQKEEFGLNAIMETVAVNLREVGDHAEKRGIKLALENIDLDEPLCDPVSLPKLIHMIDHPAVGFCLDTGHAWCSGSSIEKWIDDVGDKLIATHIHDNHGVPRCGMRGDEHLPPGFGTISWRDIILKLYDSGYRNTLNFESSPWDLPDMAEGYRCAIKYWRLCEQMAEKLKADRK